MRAIVAAAIAGAETQRRMMSATSSMDQSTI
jgi:hypothetical protein